VDLVVQDEELEVAEMDVEVPGHDVETLDVEESGARRSPLCRPSELRYAR
jgi:hypothetical protein